MRLYLDFETRSEAELRRVGPYVYANHPTTEVISVAWALGDGPVVKDAAIPLADNVLVAHNAEFERCILAAKYGMEVGWERIIDTAAKSASAGLPRALGKVADALGLTAKDERGGRLIAKLSKPRRPSKDNPDRFWERETAPEDYEALEEYNEGDVVTMREVDHALPDLSPTEQALWVLTMEMNERGIQVDRAALPYAEGEVERETARLAARWVELVGCAPGSPKGAKLLGLDSLKKASVRRALRGTLHPNVREALLTRQRLARTSVKKLPALRDRTSPDGRLRGSLVYAGAERTRRWAGAGVQPQNFPRGLGKETDLAFDAVCHPGALDLLWGDTLDTVAGMLKGFFLGPFLVGDYAQIEARVLAWLAGQWDLVQDFAAGTDIYSATASDIYGHPVTKKDMDVGLGIAKRQLGKVTILGCGYGLGWRKLQTQLEEQFNVLVSDDFAQRLVNTYREKYPCIPAFWGRLERLWRLTVQTRAGLNSGTFPIRSAFRETPQGAFAYLILPSGRGIPYFKPQTHLLRPPPKSEPGYEHDVPTESLGHFGRNIYKGGKWEQVPTYGGKLTENVVQALSRDVMAEAMLRLKQAGFDLSLTVHDEIVAEAPAERLKEFESLMRLVPKWAGGLPVEVEAYATRRYRK